MEKSKIKIITVIASLLFVLISQPLFAIASTDIIAQNSGSYTNNVVNTVIISAPVVKPAPASNVVNIVQTSAPVVTTMPESDFNKVASDNASKNKTPNSDINSSSFKLLICDGPDLSKTAGGNPKDYIPCDFKGIIMQVNHLLEIAIVLGVLVAIGGFCYAGYLFMTGTPNNITHGRKIFSSVAIGFIIMLSAWFIVYQILVWLTGSNSGFTKLLGNP